MTDYVYVELNLHTYMDMSGQLHALVALPPGKQPV
jgi:hypothetical protein